MIRSSGVGAILGLWCVLCACAVAAAQDDKPADKSADKPAAAPAADANPDAKSDSPVAASPADEQFKKTFADWKALLTKLRTMQADYRIAKPEERAGIEKSYDELVEQGHKLEPELRRSAEEAFKANPKNKEVTDFLESQARKAYDKDNAEEGLRIAELLLKGGHNDPRLYNVAGVSAFNANQYDLAKKYLDQAKDQNLLDEHGAQDLAELAKTKARWEKEAEIRKKEAAANDLPRVKIETTKGPLVVELFENEAPNSTANFISLVEKGFYNGTPFHRVLEHFMAQGGDPTGSGTGGPGYAIKCECYQPNARMHFRGSLSMAHAGRDTGGSQFFLTFVPTNHLNGKHTVFGRVVEGMDVLNKLNRVDPGKPDSSAPDKIVKATVVRKRDHAYEPQTIPDPRGK